MDFAITELMECLERFLCGKVSPKKQDMCYNTGVNRLQGAARFAQYCRERCHGKETLGCVLVNKTKNKRPGRESELKLSKLRICMRREME